MRLYVLIFTVTAIINLTCSIESSITSNLYVHEPEDGALYILRPEFTSTDIKVRFGFVASAEHIDICLILLDVASKIDYIPQTCLNSSESSIILHDIRIGAYDLVFKTSDKLSKPFNNLKNIRFTVKALKDELPKINVSVSDNVLSFGESYGDISIDYSVSHIFLSNELEVCMVVKNEVGDEVVALTCLSRLQDRLTLYRLHEGAFSIYMMLRYKHAPFTLFNNSMVTASAALKPLERSLPIIAFGHSNYEFSIPKYSDAPQTTSVNLDCEVEGHAAAKKQLQLCFSINRVSETAVDSVMESLTCQNIESKRIEATGVPAGSYVVHAVLRLLKDAASTFLDTMVSVGMEVRVQEEFVPSYEWRPLHVWHTIPNGLITRCLFLSFSNLHADFEDLIAFP